MQDGEAQAPSRRQFQQRVEQADGIRAPGDGYADRLARVLGKTGMTVIIRLSAFLLVCIGVQIMWNGISTLISSVSFHDL